MPLLCETLISRLCEAQKQFNTIKADLYRTQREYYYKSSRDLAIPVGKEVYVRRPPSSQAKGFATRFIRRFDGPYIVLGQVHSRPDLLRLQHKFAKEELKTINIEKIMVVPDGQLDSSTDLRDSDEMPRDIQTVLTSNPPTCLSIAIDPDMAKLAFAFGKYLVGLPAAKAYASKAFCHLSAGSRGTGNSETLRKIERPCLEVSPSLVVLAAHMEELIY